MGRHKDPDTLAFIEWLRVKGESLGFFVEAEYALYKNEYFVDLVWKIQENLDPLITFEIETRDGPGVFTNTAKIFGTPSKLVSKPWRHFMIIYKTVLSEGHRNSLSNVINQHNIFLLEDVFDKSEKKQELERLLEAQTYDISELVKNIVRTRSLGNSLPLVLKGISEGLNIPIKDSQISISIQSRTSPKGGFRFKLLTETPKGEPTFLDKLREAHKTLKPFTIEAPQLKDLIVDGKSAFSETAKKAKLTIVPKPVMPPPVRIIVPGTDIILDDIRFRRVNTKGAIDYLSTEDRNLPFVFGLALDRKQESGSYSLKFKPAYANVEQAYRFEELIRALNRQKELRIVEPKENLTAAIFQLDEGLEQSDVWYDLISKLAYIQRKTKHAIPAPKKITKDDAIDIHTLIRIINTGEEHGTIGDVSLEINKEVAISLISIFKEKGKISNLELSRTSDSRKVLNEMISLGPSKLKLPEMEFTMPIEEIEKLVEDTPDKGTIELSLKPISENKITIEFENWRA